MDRALVGLAGYYKAKLASPIRGIPALSRVTRSGVIAKEFAKHAGGKVGPAFKGIGKTGAIRKIQRTGNRVDAHMLIDQKLDSIVKTQAIAQLGKTGILLLQAPLQGTLGKIEITGDMLDSQ